MDSSNLSVSQVETSPSSRIEIKINPSANAKKRVDLADASINQRRCLIENCPNERAVQYCHMIGRRHTQNEPFMTNLEWNWKLQHGELNLDTRYNIFAGASLHFLHDNKSWALLPPEDCINLYYDSLQPVGPTLEANRETFPIIPNGVFSYKLIPLSDSMKSIGILRQENHDPNQPTAAADFTIHVHPFTSLPEVRSHVHPKFAIVELGRKLSAFRANLLAQILLSSPILSRVHDIYVAWVVVFLSDDALSSGWLDHDFGDGRQSDTSKKTGRDPQRGKKRKLTGGAQMSPTLSKPALGAGGGPALSHETLVDHEYTLGKAGWTRESLLSWAESVRPPVEISGANEGVAV